MKYMLAAATQRLREISVAMGLAHDEGRAKRDAEVNKAKADAAAAAEEADRAAAHFLTVADERIEAADAAVVEAVHREGRARTEHDEATSASMRAVEVLRSHEPNVLKAAIANITVR